MLYEDLLIFSADGVDNAYVVALDARTGKERWKTWRRQPWSHAYSTPLVIRAAGPRSARQHRRRLRRVAIAHPPDLLAGARIVRRVFGHGLVFIATGFQQPAIMAIRPDGTGDVTRTHAAWTGTRDAPHTPSPLIAGDHLYLVTDLGIASCLDARTGAIVWQQRLVGSFSASPVLAGGRIYFQSEDGITTVIAPGPAFTPLASNALGDAMLASMAVIDGAVIIRTSTHLYRVSGRPVALREIDAHEPDSHAPESFRVPISPSAARGIPKSALHFWNSDLALFQESSVISSYHSDAWRVSILSRSSVWSRHSHAVVDDVRATEVDDANLVAARADIGANRLRTADSRRVSDTSAATPQRQVQVRRPSRPG